MTEHDIYTMLFGAMLGGAATFAVTMGAVYYHVSRRIR